MEEIISLDYGSGGKKTSAFIENLILPLLGNDVLSELGDGAVVQGSGRIVCSTDSFVVNPYFFPGGDIGKLAVCGTVNDVCMAGGIPKYLTLAFIIEEGFPLEDMKQIIRSIRKTAEEVGVSVITGDTKVVERGKGDGIYINTTGIGFLNMPGLSPKRIKEGDLVILSGTAGDHGAAVMLARSQSLVEGEILSDCAPLHRLTEALGTLGDDLRVLRDPTRGGVATTLNEFVEGTEYAVELKEDDIPVKPSVESVCEILGLDPLYCANEGKLLAVVDSTKGDAALELIKQYSEGKDAAIIGRITKNYPGKVVIRTVFGGSRIAVKLAGAQLPRIC